MWFLKGQRSNTVNFSGHIFASRKSDHSLLKASHDHHEIRNTEERKCKLICFGGRKMIGEGLRGMKESVLLTSRDRQALRMCSLSFVHWLTAGFKLTWEKLERRRLADPDSRAQVDGVSVSTHISLFSDSPVACPNTRLRVGGEISSKISNVKPFRSGKNNQLKDSQNFKMEWLIVLHCHLMCQTQAVSYP